MFFSFIFPFLKVSSPFDSLDYGLTPVRVTASYLNERLVPKTISPCAADCGRVSAIGCVDLVIPSGDSNLGPKALSLIDF